MSNDNNQLQQILIQLASITVRPNLMSNPDLPDTWKSITTKTVNASSVGKIQLLLAKGNVGKDVVTCLSIGVPWSDFLGNYTSGFNPNAMSELPEHVTGKIPETLKNPAVMSVYSAAYFWLRSPVWELLSDLGDDADLKDKPIIITGMALGGAFAQITAMDFRPNNQGPAQQLVPWITQPPCYVFSSGNYANLDFQTYYKDTFNDASFNYRAGSEALKVDPFPDQPFNNDPKATPSDDDKHTPTFVPLGQLNYASIAVPKVYTPWEVRDANFYLQALGGTPAKFPASIIPIPHPPAGFSQALSYTLADYMAKTYKHAQQPQDAAPSPMVKSFDSGENKVVAAIFEVSNLVAVVFRGSITFEEFLAMDANTTTAATPYSETISSGVASLLYAQDCSKQTLAQRIASEIESRYKDKSLYLVGHGFGGAMANAMAADMLFNEHADDMTKPNLTGIYTFGANYFTGSGLAAKFNKALGAKSYQIRRPGDTVATALKSQPYFHPVDTLVNLLGELDTLENTNHAMSSYMALLNPERSQPE